MSTSTCLWTGLSSESRAPLCQLLSPDHFSSLSFPFLHSSILYFYALALVARKNMLATTGRPLKLVLIGVSVFLTLCIFYALSLDRPASVLGPTFSRDPTSSLLDNVYNATLGVRVSHCGALLASSCACPQPPWPPVLQPNSVASSRRSLLSTYPREPIVATLLSSPPLSRACRLTSAMASTAKQSRTRSCHQAGLSTIR
jgi:hypothetical protein